jgi:hypothetical protein
VIIPAANREVALRANEGCLKQDRCAQSFVRRDRTDNYPVAYDCLILIAYEPDGHTVVAGCQARAGIYVGSGRN